MKKFISVILSVIIAASVCSVAIIPAMAKTYASPGDVTKPIKIVVEVNGSVSSDVVYEIDKDDPSVITFTYIGDGTIIGWEFPGMELGVDYEVVSEDEDHKSITIQLIEDSEGDYVYDGDVTASAIVKGAQKTTKADADDKDKNPTSPKTGAVSAAGIAVAGAGVAILAALKKKDEE